jgi:hypothetical protein
LTVIPAEAVMLRILVPIIVAALVAAGIALTPARVRRGRRDAPELNEHPERLEEMLDPTDDA